MEVQLKLIKSITIKSILPIFLTLIVLPACCLPPIPVFDTDYKKTIGNMSWFIYKNRVWVLGGNHTQTLYKYWEFELFSSPWKYASRDVKNKRVYSNGAISTIFQVKQDGISTAVDLENGWKYEGKCKNENLFRDSDYFIEHNGKMFLIGGTSMDLPRFGDVWVSHNGVEWERIVERAPWAEEGFLINHKMISFGKYIYVIGGNNGEVNKNIWRSIDGKKWELYSQIPDVEDVLAVYTFKNKLYVYGENDRGQKGIYRLLSNDEWILKVYEHEFSSAFVDYKNKIWNFQSHGIYVSEDGIDWKQIISGPHYSRDYLLQDNVLYTEFEGSIASTENGIDFNFIKSGEKITIKHEKSIKNFHYSYDDFKLLKFKNFLWALGPSADRIYFSYNGLNWKKVEYDERTSFLPRSKFGATVYKNRIWIAGGVQTLKREIAGSSEYLYFVLNDVWSTTDGRNWKLKTPHAEWNNRSRLHLFVYENRLNIVGGSTYGRDYYGSWISSDGKIWRRKTSNFANLMRSGCIRPDFSNMIVERNQLTFFDSYVQDSFIRSKDGYAWTLGEFKYNRPDMDKIIIVRNPHNNRKVYMAYEDYLKFYVSYDMQKWTKLENVTFNKKPESGFEDGNIILYKNKIVLVETDFEDGKIQSVICKIDWKEM